MSLPNPSWVDRHSVGRWCQAAAFVGCVTLAGCVSLDQLRGEKFPEDENSRLCQQLREPEKTEDPYLFSNRARQISRHLGGE